ncbi:MAG: TorF family putative porin [Bacteroidales bacterium]
MKRFNAILISSACFLLVPLFIKPLSAQEKTSKSKLDISADVVSRYVWRGLNLGGSSPSIQPGMEFSSGDFTIGAWGAYSMSSATTSQEADLYLCYTLADVICFTATDYYFPKEDTLNHYFNYEKDKTTHIFEFSAKFLGTEKLPLSLMVATNLYGADAKKSNGEIQYSTYVELGYNFKVNETGCSAFMGFTPNNPDRSKGETGFYGPYAGVINLGITATRELKITDTFSLPVNASLITNPQAENIFLVFGISL